MKNLTLALITAVLLAIATPASAQNWSGGGMSSAQWDAARNAAAQNVGAAGRPGLGVKGTLPKNPNFGEMYAGLDRTRAIAVGQANAHTNQEVGGLRTEMVREFGKTDAKIAQVESHGNWGLWGLLGLLGLIGLLCCFGRGRRINNCDCGQPKKSCHCHEERACRSTPARNPYGHCGGDGMPNDDRHNGVRVQFDSFGRRLDAVESHQRKQDARHDGHDAQFGVHGKQIAGLGRAVQRVGTDLRTLDRNIALREKERDAQLERLAAALG